jgi:hypothetical protein
MRSALCICGLAGCVLSFTASIIALGFGEPLWWLFLSVAMVCLLVAVAAVRPVRVTNQPMENLFRLEDRMQIHEIAKTINEAKS